MQKTITLIFSTIILGAVIAACSAAQPTPANPAGNAPASTPNPNAPLNLTLEEKLAFGTLKLEGTSQAVTAQQAAQLLPLWQQVQTLERQGNASSSDLQAVYKQIESDMTSNQIETIQGLNLTYGDLQAEMQQLGIQGGFGGQNADQRATRIAQFETQNPGTPFPSRGTPGARPNFQGTPNPNRTPGQGGFGGRGMTFIFVNPLVQLLQTRAGSQ